MTKQLLFPFDFGNAFISIPLNTLNIESEEESDIDESEELNTNI